MEELREMQLHDIKELNRWLTVIKVPGGCMYSIILMEVWFLSLLAVERI